MRLVAEIAVIVAGAIAALVAVPSAAHRKRARRGKPKPRRPTDLERLERLVVTGRATARDVHLRLRPVLREVAVARLRARGVQLDRDPIEAREALGEDLWEIVRADRHWPEDPRAPGISIEQLTAAIGRLESL